MKTLIQLSLAILVALAPYSLSANQDQKTDDVARRGCCSHHDGVCGCSNGRQECCDGSLSPSCTCLKSDPDDGTVGSAEDCQEENIKEMAL